MELPSLFEGRLVKRYKRFLADIETAEGVITAHCPNTGAMTGCAEPGSPVWYSLSDNPKRKYAATLEFVRTTDGDCSVNTGRANALVGEALRSEWLLPGIEDVKAEVKIPSGAGRFDFGFTLDGRQGYVEVKSVTLHLEEGSGVFPDAVSERAVKHVKELEAQVREGSRSLLVFCVQHLGIEKVSPAWEIHGAYGDALAAAMDVGVEVLACGCELDLDVGEMRMNRKLPFNLR